MRLNVALLLGLFVFAVNSPSAAQGSSRVIGNATRVVTGTTARAVVPPPSADRKAATVLRLPILMKPLPPSGGSPPGPAPAPAPGVPAPTPNPPPPPPVFEPRFTIDRFGLVWAADKGSFDGTVGIFIVDTLRPHQVPQPLPNAPIVFRLSADGATLNPPVASINKSNEPASVVVSFAGVVNADSIRMHVEPLGLDAPVDISIAVTKVPLDLKLVDTMYGLGLGRAEVDVALGMAGHGDSVMVKLNPSHGSVSPEGVWVGFNRPGKAVFRSGGLGTGTLTAKVMGPGFGEAHADVAYVWPTGFTVAALLGILIGGIGTMAFRKLPWTGSNVFSAFAGGFVAGVLLSIAGSVLGVRIGNFDPASGGGLALVFVLAAIGAILGSQVTRLLVPAAAGN